MLQLSMKTEKQIDEESEDMLKFYAEVLANNPEYNDVYTVDQLFANDLGGDEVLKMLYKRIAEIGKACVASKGHSFVYRKPPHGCS